VSPPTQERAGAPAQGTGPETPHEDAGSGSTPRLTPANPGYRDACITTALALAARGVPTFPCWPTGQKNPRLATDPVTGIGGHLLASTSPGKIRGWWRSMPDSLLAMRTGTPGWDVIDVDERDAGTGWPAFHALRAAGLAAHPAFIVATPSGAGRHYYYPSRPGNRCKPTKLWVDFKAEGGYIICPPSLNDRGGRYRMVHRDPGGGRPVDFAACWEVLGISGNGSQAPVTALDPPLKQKRANLPPKGHSKRFEPVAGWTGSQREMDALASTVARATEGTRNTTLFEMACCAVRNGHSDLSPLVAAALTAGLGQAEIDRTVDSARGGPR